MGVFILQPSAPATTSAQALANLQGFQSGQKSPDEILQSEQQNLGTQAAQQQVTGLQGAINNTTNLLNQVAPSVMGRTQNSLVTSAQATNQIGQEQAPIQANLAKDTTDYNTANTNYTNLEQEAESLANAQVAGNTNQESYLQNIYNDLATQEQNAAQQAEAEREFNVSQANARAASTTPVLAGGASLTPATSGGVGKAVQNSAGGYAFTNAAGAPVTMAQYLSANGYQTSAQIAQAAAGLLSQSGTASDKQIAAAIQSGNYTPAQLAQMFPQVFGGSF